MKKIRTFSRAFPVYHPKAKQETYFVEKVWMSLIELGEISLSRCCELSRETNIGNFNMNNLRKSEFKPKYHTIREGKHFNAGDWITPKVWTGRPYWTSPIIIAPNMEVKKIFDIEIRRSESRMVILINDRLFFNWDLLAENDGLNRADLLAWFLPYVKIDKPFIGQIICWNESISY